MKKIRGCLINISTVINGLIITIASIYQIEASIKRSKELTINVKEKKSFGYEYFLQDILGGATPTFYTSHHTI